MRSPAACGHPDRNFDTMAAAATDVCAGLAALTCGAVAWMPAEPAAGAVLASLMDELAAAGEGSAANPTFPLAARTLGTARDGHLQVAPLRAWLADHEGALTAVWNGDATPYLCRPLQRGAGVVVEDLRTWTPPALLAAAGFDPRACDPVPVLVARTETARARWDAWADAAYPAVSSRAACDPRDERLALLAAGLPTLSLVAQRRSDTALVAAHYLAAHPRVTWVSYPGLEADPANDVARRTLEHGFGSRVTFGVDGQVAATLAEKPLPATPLSCTASKLVPGPAPCAYDLTCGLENALDVVALLDAFLAVPPA